MQMIVFVFYLFVFFFKFKECIVQCYLGCQVKYYDLLNKSMSLIAKQIFRNRWVAQRSQSMTFILILTLS